jgi:hypothetical protein
VICIHLDSTCHESRGFSSLMMCWLRSIYIFPLFFFWGSELQTTAIIDSNYVSVHHKSLQLSKICSLLPQSWIAKAMKPATTNAYIKEIIYVPSQLSLSGGSRSDIKSCCQDDHFCSLLCDKGFTVHIIDYSLSTPMNDVLEEVVRWRIREHRVQPRSLAILAHELIIPKTLSFLAEVALPMRPNRVDLGAVVLLDPPPLYALMTPRGRKQVLERYIEAYSSFDSFRCHVNNKPLALYTY